MDNLNTKTKEAFFSPDSKGLQELLDFLKATTKKTGPIWIGLLCILLFKQIDYCIAFASAALA